MSAQADLPASAPLAPAPPPEHGAPASPAAPAAAISAQPLTERGKLEAMMADRTSAYWMGGDAEKNQARYRALVEGAPEQAQPTQPAIEHGYDFSRFNVGEQEAPLYHDFGNAMAKAGFEQKHVEAAIEWQRGQDAKASAADEKIFQSTISKLQSDYGTEFQSAAAEVVRFIKGQGSSARMWLDAMASNSPDGFKIIYNWAKQEPRDVTEPRPDSGGEREKLEMMMRDRGGAYWRSPKAEQLQARYRELVGDQPARPQQTSGKDGIYERGARARFIPS